MPSKKPRKRRSSGTRKPSSARQRMWPWYALGVAIVAAIVARENLDSLTSLLRPGNTVRISEQPTARPKPAEPPRRAPERLAEPAEKRPPTPAAAMPPAPTPDTRPLLPPQPIPVQPSQTAGGTAFFYCGIKQDNCIIDGGNFVYHGVKIRLADIYVPATKEAKCDRERNLGGDAKEALRLLLNAGDFELAAWKPIDEDQYGRKLRIVVRNGKSIGDALVARGYARPWTGQRESWCP